MKSDKKRTVKYQPACHSCNAVCCRYIVKHIDKPKTKADFDIIRWYLMHKNVQAGIDLDGDWMVEFIADCKYLNKDRSCGIYKTRPLVCRNYPEAHENCENEDPISPYSLLFTSDKQFSKWVRKKKPGWKWQI